jgi:RHS repeat-associated protein
VNFQYDAFGRRIYKSSPAGTSLYVYDGASVIQELGSPGNLLASYTQGVGIDEPLAMYQGLTTAYFQADGLGSITSLTDPTGALAASYVYDSFGNLTASTGTATNPFQFTGREFDPETGLYYYRARYYDPVSGRFVSEDPVRFESGVDFYPYVSNSPVDLNDPLGQFLPSWHRDMTYALARAVFGPKCESQAAAVADADANVDAFNYGIGHGPLGSAIGAIRFFSHSGQGWAQPGPHFPTQDMLDQAHYRAMNSCNLTDLGEGLHSLQDSYAHSGWDSFSHYTYGTIPDTTAAQSAAADNAMLATESWLREFKERCLGCCK